jgi:AhpD family alkylhydroperoxidase
MSLDNRTKELIAIGASVSANCLPCLEFHAGKARELEAKEEEIKDAIEVGKLVRRGAAAKMDKLASEINQAPIPANDKVNGNCGCG